MVRFKPAGRGRKAFNLPSTSSFVLHSASMLRHKYVKKVVFPERPRHLAPIKDIKLGPPLLPITLTCFQHFLLSLRCASSLL